MVKVNTAPRTFPKECAAQKVSFRRFSKNLSKNFFLDEDEMNVWWAAVMAVINSEDCSCK